MAPVNEKLMDDLVGDARKAMQRVYTARGLSIAQSICRSRMPDAFDIGAQNIVLSIIKDICDTMDRLE